MDGNTEIKIDKGVPVPAASDRAQRGYPWAQCQPGDSFFIPTSAADGSTTLLQQRLGAGGRTRGKRMGEKWVTRDRTENGVKGVRVWRTA